VVTLVPAEFVSGRLKPASSVLNSVVVLVTLVRLLTTTMTVAAVIVVATCALTQLIDQGWKSPGTQLARQVGVVPGIDEVLVVFVKAAGLVSVKPLHESELNTYSAGGKPMTVGSTRDSQKQGLQTT